MELCRPDGTVCREISKGEKRKGGGGGGILQGEAREAR
jgi:hypothetical protein